MRFFCVSTMEDLARLIEEIGILPFFPTSVPGWSLEENIHPDVWFTDAEGPWEWKGLMASRKQCVYGKFIRGKAAFVSLPFFRHLANWRRESMPFEERVGLGLISHRDQMIYDYHTRFPGTQARVLRQQFGSKGIDTALTRLEMSTFVVTQSTAYNIAKDGHPYGWGNSVFITADAWLGDFVEPVSSVDSLHFILEHLASRMPDVHTDRLRSELRM